MKDLIVTITPPKGVRRKSTTPDDGIPPDEGIELLDCEDSELEDDEPAEKEEIEEFNTDDEEIEFGIQNSEKVDGRETVKDVLNSLVDQVVTNVILTRS